MWKKLNDKISSESTAIEEAFIATLESVVEECRKIIKEKRPVYQDVWWEIPSRTIDHLVAFRSIPAN